MRTHSVILSVLLTTALAGCPRDPVNPSGEVDIRGLSDTQAAEIVSETMCTKLAQCPAEECSCYAEPDGPAVCECEIVWWDKTDCTEEMYDEILYDLQASELTPAEQQLVNDCVNAFVDTPCLTEAQVQANIAAIEADQDPPYEHEIPIECEQMGELFSQEPTPAEESVPNPQPGG